MRVERILVLQKADLLADQRAAITAQLVAALPGVAIDCAGAPEAVVAGARYDAVIAPTLPWLPQALARLDGWTWLHLLSAGVDGLWDMGIDLDDRILTCSRGIHGIPMSEYALGAMLHFTKRFDQFITQSHERRWERTWLGELHGRTVMIVGLGHIGGCIAERARAFGVRVLGVQRQPRPHPAADAVLGLDTFHDHLGEVDFLVVTVPRTAATQGMIGNSVLRRLKPGAVIVNLARGGVVCETSLLAALNDGHLRGAALDVFDTQPLPESSPLWDRPDVLITPHVSGTSPHYLQRALEVFVDNAQRLRAGEPAATPVDRAAGY